MSSFRCTLLSLLAVTFPLFCQPAAPQGFPYQPPANLTQLPVVTHEKVRNIILLIGDGMSISTVSNARIHGAGVSGAMHMDRMPIAGFVRTCSADNLITDSAAASSAMACGLKTNNGRISRTPDGNPGLSILSACQQKGMAAGLIVTSSVTHATPAGFGAHAMSRKEEPLIAENLLLNHIDVLLGGGRAFFIPQTLPESRRHDDRNLLEEARASQYTLLSTRDELLAAKGPRVLGLFAEEGMQTLPPGPSLAEMTAKGLALLSQNKKGFFLMIEGSQIDWANHEHNAENSVRQTLDFDMAVAAALRFAEVDRHTLVVVTADHETGGLSIIGGRVDGSEVELSWSTDDHTGATVPLYAYGPGALRLSGFHENTDIPKAFAALLHITPFPVILEEPLGSGHSGEK
ncbi:MAG TPA: alkaline phosphatase [bacterium]|nr:alkaline phosphatase [bacterium]HQJ65935.1 alkaline phosphatase [bacterium]